MVRGCQTESANGDICRTETHGHPLQAATRCSVTNHPGADTAAHQCNLHNVAFTAAQIRAPLQGVRRRRAHAHGLHALQYAATTHPPPTAAAATSRPKAAPGRATRPRPAPATARRSARTPARPARPPARPSRPRWGRAGSGPAASPAPPCSSAAPRPAARTPPARARRRGGRARGLARGMAHGLARGLANGLARGPARGLARGLACGLPNGLAPVVLQGCRLALRHRAAVAQARPRMRRSGRPPCVSAPLACTGPAA